MVAAAEDIEVAVGERCIGRKNKVAAHTFVCILHRMNPPFAAINRTKLLTTKKTPAQRPHNLSRTKTGLQSG